MCPHPLVEFVNGPPQFFRFLLRRFLFSLQAAQLGCQIADLPSGMFLGCFCGFQDMLHVDCVLRSFVHLVASLIRPRARLGQPVFDLGFCLSIRLILMHHGQEAIRLCFRGRRTDHSRSLEQESVSSGNLPCLAGFEFLPQAIGSLEVLNHPTASKQCTHHRPQLVAAMHQFTCHAGSLTPVWNWPGCRHTINCRDHNAEAAISIRRQ